MKIEDVIQQTKPFTNTKEKALVNLIYTAGWLKMKEAEFMRPFRLTSKQYNILRILRGARGPISTSAIRERMLDKMSDVSRIVDRLEIKKFVLKSTCPSDQRKVDILITNEALDLLARIDERMPLWLKEYSGLSMEEAGLLSDLLDKMRID